MGDRVLAARSQRRGERPADLPLLEALTPPAVMLALIGGVLVAGRSTTSAVDAAGRAAAWFGVMLAVSAQIARRRPATRLALAVGYGLAAAVAVTLLGLPSLRDHEVSEFVATGVPPTGVWHAGSVELSAGSFDALAHPGMGRAAIVEVPDGRRVLTFTDFSTRNGADLRVYLVGDDPAAGRLDGAVHVGRLKGNRGDQQYELPTDLDPTRYSHVVIWSQAFAIGFTSATLAPAGA